MNEKDVDGFEKVLDYIYSYHPGWCIVGSPMDARLYFNRYLGIGEGAEMQYGDEEDIKELIRELKKNHTEEALVAKKI